MGSLPEFDSETQQIEERLAARRHARAAKRASNPPIDPYVAAAAVLVDFDPLQLNPAGMPDSATSAALALTPLSQVLVRDGQTRWALRNDPRRQALRSLAATNSLDSALEANPQEPSNPTQQVLADLIRGTWDYVMFTTPEQLAAALQASQWLAGIVPNLPDTAELTNRLSRARFLAPFENLAGEGFVGRETELQVLNDFVGIPEVSSTAENATSAFRGWLLQPKSGALVVYGLGGVGKSSLIARFILIQEGARLAFTKFPIVYFDFDDSSKNLVRSETLCLETARQLAMQYPGATGIHAQMRAAYAESMESANDLELGLEDIEQSNIVIFQQSLNFWRTWFPQLMAAIAGPSPSDPPPFLIAFDTFEENIARNRLAVSQILRLIEVIQTMYPGLRPIISGRALNLSFGEDLSKAFRVLELKEFDPMAAIGYLQKRGVTDTVIAATLVRQVGCSPLSLKLAAQAVKRGEKADAKSGFVDLKTTSWLVFSATETVIQGQLYQRILAHIGNPEVRKLAHPGLVLRRVTPDLIRVVLAGPCNLTLPADPTAQEGTAQALFDELRKEFSLVESCGVNAVRPSNEIRRVMLAMIERERPGQVGAIHNAAVEYYFQHGTTPDDRAEEIYHRLKRGEDASIVFQTRWLHEAGQFLEDALPELPPAVQLTLASYAGLKLPNESSLLKAANLEDWERVTERRVQEGLATNRSPVELLALLNERNDRSEMSPLYLAKARVLAADQNPSAAILELQRGVDAMAAAGAKQALFTHLHALGNALAGARRVAEARQVFLEAVRLSQELDLPRSAFQAALQNLTLAPTDPEAVGVLIDTMRRLSDSDWRDAFSSIIDGVTLLGKSISPNLAQRFIGLASQMANLSPGLAQRAAELLPQVRESWENISQAVAGSVNTKNPDVGVRPKVSIPDHNEEGIADIRRSPNTPQVVRSARDSVSLSGLRLRDSGIVPEQRVRARASINLPSDFLFGHVRPDHKVPAAPPQPPPPLGPLAAFVGDWVGNGFNTIFRPDNSVTPTPLPNPVPPPPPPRDNVLELNLTNENLAFSKSLGSVPNRGTTPQGDIFLNGVPYLQTINDVTIRGEKVGIHVEPGIWVHVPATTVPPITQETVCRMASIPHGTTINAQGVISTVAGPPNIAAVDITPFLTATPHNKIKFPSQTATNPNTARIPQDLSSFIAAGTITQALLDDPNSLLRAHISKQKIVSTTTLFISTAPPPPPPLFGGGTDNIAFLLGQAAATAPNAQATQMIAVFWVETVEEVITVPPMHVGGPPFAAKATPSVPGQRVPTFSVTAPFDTEVPRQLTVRFTQIQYTQTVLLNFAGLTWPHVSVNTLVPADEITVPSSVWK